MKKILILCVAVFTLAACNKSDDNTDPTTHHKIVGTWKLNAEIDDDGGFVWEEIDGYLVEYRSDGTFESFSPIIDQWNNIRNYQIIDDRIIYLNPDTNEEMGSVSYEINEADELVIDFSSDVWLLMHRFNRVGN